MDWIVLTLIAALLYTSGNYIDKFIVANKIKDVNGLIIFTAIAGLIMGTSLWTFNGFPTLSYQNAIIVMLSGALTIWAGVLYFKALSQDEASKVIILFQTTPIFVLVLSLIFLKEFISMTQFLGFSVILTSTIFLSLDNSVKQFRLSKAFWYILGVNMLWAIATIALKYAVGEMPFTTVLAFESFGMAIGGLTLVVLFKDIRTSFINTAKQIPMSVLGLIYFNECIFISAKTLNIFAYTLGPASLVRVVASTQALFAIVVGYTLTRLLPKFFDEDIKKETLKQKLFLGIFIIIGLVLVGE